MKKPNLTACILITLALLGCNGNQDGMQQKIDQAEAKVDDLKRSTNAMVVAINQQAELINDLAQRVEQLESSLQVAYEEYEEYEEDCSPEVIAPAKKTPKNNNKSDVPPELKSRFSSDALNVVIFKEDWCPHCRKYMAAIQNWDDPKIKFIVIDTEKEPAMAKFKKKNGIPETQIYSQSGKFQQVTSGFSNKADLQAQLRAFQ